MNADREVDLLIVGAGPAGMTAALVASLEGLDVLLCEKSDQVGGTGATSAGTLWIPGNSESKAAGYKDSAEAAERYLDALIGRSTNRELRTAYLKTGPVAIDYLSARTDVKFLACGKHPDYRSNMPGAAITGRAIIPQPFDGRLLGEDFRRVRPPIPEFMVFGGMMVGKADIPPLIGRFQSVANFIYSREAVRALPRRPPEISARHEAHDGQRAHRPAVLQPQKEESADPVRRHDRRLHRRPARRVRRAHRLWRQRHRGQGPQGRRAGDGRLRAQQELPRRVHAATCAAAFDEPRWKFRRRHQHRPADRRPDRARGARQQWALDAGFDHDAAGWQRGALPASRARPRQARPDRGELCGSPLRQRGRLLPRLRGRHVRKPQEQFRRFRPI